MLISFAALFLSVFLLQVSSGGVGPLDALVGLHLGFATGQIGLLGSAHFAGFFVGCWWAPRLLGSVGAGRTFPVFTSLGAMGILGHTLTDDPTAWTLMRVATGLCISGCYTVIEAWLQAKVTNQTRGRTYAIYRLIDISGSLIAQLIVGFLADMETYVAYNLLCLICCASLLPLALTRVPQPPADKAPKLKPLLALQRSPLAVAGVVVTGLTGAAYRMIGPVYGKEMELLPAQIGMFLALFVMGGAVAQYPAGWAADRYDRRWVLIYMSAGAFVTCMFSMFSSDLWMIYTWSFLFGAVSLPIYSVAVAHAHDFAQDHERVELSAALIFYFAAGAIVSPLVGSWLIALLGPKGFFGFIGLSHVALMIYGPIRMRARPTVENRTAYVYAPRTSFTIGNLLARFRNKK